MKMQYGKRQAVAPVLATLLMIAVAVAMSVIIFMWSQGFLSQTSGSTGSQQGAQNQAAQSSIAIETATFVTGTSTPSLSVIIRNVGAVAVTLGSATVTGSSSNAAFKGTLIYTWTTSASTDVTETSGTWTIGTATDVTTEVSPAKGGSVVFTLTGASVASGDTSIASGDVINIKVTTNVGTFASGQFSVP